MTIDEMHIGDKRIFVNIAPMMQSLQIFIAGKNLENGKRVIVSDLKWAEVSDGDLYTDNIVQTLWLQMDNAQALIDDLWKVGLRPSEGTGSAGSLKATENHLKDIQKLMWQLLPKALRNEKD